MLQYLFLCSRLALHSHRMKKILQFIEENLSDKRSRSHFRSLQSYSKGADFFSNDYLGLSRILPSSISGRPHGAGGSRLISGNHKEYTATEVEIAKAHGVESALIFPTGYMANIGLLSSLPQRGDLILFDELCHASIRDGIRLSHAHALKFKHNSTEDLHRLLNQQHSEYRHIYIVTESVFSMDGDVAPLKPITELAHQYGAGLIVDEAHALGFFGYGLVGELELTNRVLATVVTFSKAIGLHGGAILSNLAVRDFIINYSRSFIFTTGLPPENVRLIREAYTLLNEEGPRLRDHLTAHIEELNSLWSEKTRLHVLPSATPIQAVILGSNEKAKALESTLMNNDFLVKAILHPTVPKGTERVRISLHSFNTSEEIHRLAQTINAFFDHE